MFPPLDIARVLDHCGADYVPDGYGWRKMRCPFHDDREASAAVNVDAGAFTCHACGVRGDGYSLIRHHLGVDDWRTVLAAAEGFVSEGAVVPVGEVSGRRRRAYKPPGRRRRS